MGTKLTISTWAVLGMGSKTTPAHQAHFSSTNRVMRGSSTPKVKM